MTWRFYTIFVFLLFLNCKEDKIINHISLQKKYTIGILPYYKIEKYKIDTIKSTLEKFYNLEVIVLPEIEAPKSAFTNLKSARYRADSLIKFQKKMLKSKKITHILGLSNFDISTTKKKEPFTKYQDWGIMGLGYCPGNSCIVSTFRLQNKNKNIFWDRYKKVVIHEMGHNFGLPHCPDKKCVMTDAVESVKTIDNAAMKICKICTKKIKI
ncbi:MAG: zinc-dependent metalloprotease family protein [Flavobacterium sp.]